MIEAYLSTTRVGWRNGTSPAQWVDVPDIGAALEALGTHHEAVNGRGVRVWVSARLAPPVILPPSTGARSTSEIAALVRHAFREAFSDSTDFKTWTTPWKPDRALVATAMSSELLDTLRRMPNGTRSHWWSPRASGVLSIRPWWNIPWAMTAGDQRTSDQCFTLEEPDGLLFWRLSTSVSGDSRAWIAQPAEALKTQQRRRFDATSPAGAPAATHWCLRPEDGALPIGELSLIDESAVSLPTSLAS